MANKTMHHVVIGSDTFEIVDQYAREHGVTIDSTLAQSGQAADAKAVGEALADKADSADVTALDTRVTAVEGDIDETNERLGDIKEDINSVESSVIQGFLNLTSSDFVNGTYSNGQFTTANAKRIRTDRGIFVPKGSKIVIAPTEQSVEYDLFNKVSDTGDLSTDYSRTYSSSWITTETELNITEDKYVFFIIKTTNDTAISPSALSSDITIYNSLAFSISEKLSHYSEKAFLKIENIWVAGYKIGSTGYRNASDEWQITPFFQVAKGDVIRYKLKGVNAATFFLAFYTTQEFKPASFVKDNSVISSNVETNGAYVAQADGYIVFCSMAGYSGSVIFDDYVPDYAAEENSLVPPYWSSALSSVIDTVKNNRITIGKDLFEFIFITDTHFDQNAKNSPLLINYLAKQLELKTVVFGGDVITGTHSTKQAALDEVYSFYQLFDTQNLDIITTLGNHDLNNNTGTSAQLTLSESYPLYIKRMEQWTEIEKDTTCAVYDNDTQEVRVIEFLHPTSSYSNADVTSFINSKIAEKTGWTFVFVCHAYWNSKPAGTALSANSASTSLAKSIADSLNANGCNGFWLCGHTHRDFSDTVTSDSEHTISVVCTTTDAYNYAVSDGGPDMTLGTDTEQAFDIVQIDTSNKIIHMTRVGAGESRNINY